MKPKWQPVAFPEECAPYGEQPFQPLVLPEDGIVVAGGPSALFLFQMFDVPKVIARIRAIDRIAGFAVRGSEVYVQDGPVLSRWNLVTGEPASAINVLATAQRWKVGDGAPDWTALHKLPDTMRAKQVALQKARRRVEWATLLEDAERELDLWRRRPDAESLEAAIVPLERMVGAIQALLGPGGIAGARSFLAQTIVDAATLIISAPVVRAHKIWGRQAGMVFVIGRDGTIHPLDDKLDHMGTKRIHKGAQPALALSEFPTEADSDEFACRLYYVADDGSVQALDGGAIPLVPLASWPARGPANLDVRLRPRVQDGLLWGGGAQGSGVFALTVDRVTEPSRVTLPEGDWRWVEVRTGESLALASTPERTTLLSFAKGARTIERWGKRQNVPPGFATFLPQSSAPSPRGRPLLVLEIDRDATDADLAFRVLVANSVDAADSASSAWYPPVPAILFTGAMEGWGGTNTQSPKAVRTQPSVSRQDAYVIAADHTRSEKIVSLQTPIGTGSWRVYYAELMKKYPEPGAAAAYLGMIPLPPLAGTTSLYCYSIGKWDPLESTCRHASLSIL